MIRKLLSNILIVSVLLTLVINLVPATPIAKATTYSGVEFKVGVIDTGIDYSHQYLNENVLDECSKDFITNTNGRAAANDSDGHGTRVAGLIGATLNTSNGMVGMNPKAQLCSLKVFETVPDRYSAIAAESNIVNAIDYAAGKGIRLINMSWGSYVGSTAIKNAILNHPNILFVAAAGDSNIGEAQLNLVPLTPNRMNSFNNDDLKSYYPASYPFPNLISVTGTDFDGRLWGNYGVTSVDLSALGFATLTTDKSNSYGYFTGTYVSTALVAGAASYYWGIDSTKMNIEVKAAVLGSVDKIPTMTGVTLTSGILNLSNLLNNSFTSVIVRF